MRYLVGSFFIFLFFSIHVRANSDLSVPILKFDRSFSIDSQRCPNKPTDYSKIETESGAYFDQFEKNWNQVGKLLIQFTISEFERGFANENLVIEAKYSLCGMGSFAYPLTLDIYSLMKSNTDQKAEFFTQYVFHELLHRYIRDNLGSSEILNKYNRESLPVRQHIHLMAIQYYVLEHVLGLQSAHQMVEFYLNMRDRDYPRAMEIVIAEGYLRILDDFKRGLKVIWE